MIKCEICDKEFNKLNQLSFHLSKTHKMTTKEYYDLYLKKPGEGICKHCGEEAQFYKFGYRLGCVSTNKAKASSPIFWIIRGYTEEEAIIKSKLHNKAAAKINANKPKEQHRERSVRCKEYWLVLGLTEEEASTEVRRVQSTFSLDKCMEKHGAEKGRQVWAKRQEKWQKSVRTLENIQKSGKVASRISQRLFWEIMRVVPAEHQAHTYFAEHQHEYALYDRNNECFYLYDFVITSLKICVEFHGDVWHGNPLLFNETDTPNPYQKSQTCRDIWEHDAIKRKCIEDRGYTMKVIWESDYIKNPECINQLIQEIETKWLKS